MAHYQRKDNDGNVIGEVWVEDDSPPDESYAADPAWKKVGGRGRGRRAQSEEPAETEESSE